MLPFFMLLIYILPVYRMISRIVSEKETMARDSMKMMGLTEFSYWMSWFTYYFFVVSIISAAALGIVSINVIVHSNKFIIFAYFWVYGMSLFGLIMFF
jgi:ATP-binding cassette, subfamily A (ABC1), member 3